VTSLGAGFRALAAAALLLWGGAAQGAEPPGSCGERFTLESASLDESLSAARRRWEQLGFRVGRLEQDKGNGLSIRARKDRLQATLFATGGREETAALVRIVVVELAPEGGGDRFLASAEQRFGPPGQKLLQRDPKGSGMISEALVWTDHACDVRVVALVRRETTPTGAVLRYGAIELRRLSALVGELRDLERAADDLGGI
jgi:hypothetical protein